MRVVFVRRRGPIAAFLSWWNRSRWSGVYVGEHGSEHVYSCNLMMAVHDEKLSDVRARHAERLEMLIPVPDIGAGLDFLASMVGVAGEEIRSDELPSLALEAAGRQLPTFYGSHSLVGLDGLRQALALAGAGPAPVIPTPWSSEEIAAFKRVWNAEDSRVPSLFPGEVTR
jgi:hypothetical protein